MAESFKDCEFWLPPQFLTDDDILMVMDNKGAGVKGCCGFASDLSSPVESVLDSTETESDEEDYLAGLTRQMTHSTLEDSFRKPNSGFASENTKAWVMAGSPQSTLCPLGSGSGCGCRQGSSRGSPTEPFQGRSSSPATWDLLYAAAGEVARMRMNDEGSGYNPRKPSPISIPVKNPTLDLGFHSNQSISHQQFQATQFQQMKQQQMMVKQSQAIWGEQLKASTPNQQHHHAHQMAVQNRARNSEMVGNRSSRQMGLSASAWPPLQQHPQQNGSGMRAVFLGTSGSKKECAGTGVFLPRRVGYPPETRKKPACSTALLPARVIQALNLNLDDMGATPPPPPPPPPPQMQSRFNGSFTSDTDYAQMIRSNNVLLQAQAQQKRNNRSRPVMNHEIRLPQEWTY